MRIRHSERSAWTPNGASLKVAPGEVVLLLGPSGCGKSTLALATNGLVPQRIDADVTGSVTAGGLDATVTSVARLSREVAMVFQDPDAQVITATVLDEVCFGPENLQLPVETVHARAESALRSVGLWERRDDDPAVLSGGGRQRLAIACALAMDTPLIVLDEPTANLDPVGADEVYAALACARDAHGGRAILLIEHRLEPALDLVDRVVVLDAHGRTAFDGGVREVLVERAEEVAALGVWLPAATSAALRLRTTGVVLEPLPLTPAELAAALPPTIAPSIAVQAKQVSKPDDAVATPAVTLSGVSLTKGPRHKRAQILDDVSLQVRRGSLTAVVGVNGAGKSSLLQVIGAVQRPTAGSVELCGRVGFVFQNPEHQFVTNSVAAELLHGLDGADQAVLAQVEDLLAQFGLSEARDVHPFLLSGGQKRRLSVGTALISSPPVLVLDEPTYGQDRARAEAVMAILADVRAHGVTRGRRHA